MGKASDRDRLPAPLLLMSVGVAALLIGTLSLVSTDPRYFSPLYWPDLISRLVSLYSLGGMSTTGPVPQPLGLQTARFLGSIFSLIALGVGLRALLWEQLSIFRAGIMRRHTIVCGLGAKGAALCRNLAHSPGRRGVAAVEVANDPEWILSARLHGVAVIIGDASERGILKLANAVHAASFISITGSDRLNIEMAVALKRLLDSSKVRKRIGGATLCAVHVGDSRLRDLLQHSNLIRGGNKNLTVRFFSTAHLTSRQFFVENHAEGTIRRPSRVHLTLFGFNQVAESIAVQFAAIAHFAGQPQLSVTVVDENAKSIETEFLARYPEFGGICTLSFQRYNPGDKDSRRLGFLDDDGADGEARLIMVAKGNDSANIAAALEIQALRPRLNLPMHVHITETEGISSLLEESGPVKTGIIPFGSFAKVCTAELVLGESLDLLAKRIHEDYCGKMLSSATGGGKPAETPWDELSEEYREANRRQADHLPVKLRAVNCRLSPIGTGDCSGFAFTPEEIEMLARMEHARWCADRRLRGFRYCAKSDYAARQHAMLVPWEELPDSEKEKDIDAVRNIPALAALIGCKVQRDPCEAEV
jgi:voltage-gated potassium channel Kch